MVNDLHVSNVEGYLTSWEDVEILRNARCMLAPINAEETKTFGIVPYFFSTVYVERLLNLFRATRFIVARTLSSFLK